MVAAALVATTLVFVVGAHAASLSPSTVIDPNGGYNVAVAVGQSHDVAVVGIPEPD